jgi:hypothetical protein
MKASNAKRQTPSNVVSLIERRQLRRLSEGIAELEAQIAQYKLQSDPELARKVAFAQFSWLHCNHKGLIGQMAPIFTELLEIAMASQLAAGEEINWHMAIAIALGHTGVNGIEERAHERVKTLPAEYRAYRALGVDIKTLEPQDK